MPLGRNPVFEFGLLTVKPFKQRTLKQLNRFDYGLIVRRIRKRRETVDVDAYMIRRKANSVLIDHKDRVSVGQNAPQLGNGLPQTLACLIRETVPPE